MFKRPYKLIGNENKFSLREVGLTHPDVSSFIKLADNGDIHIMAQDGLGIIISSTRQSIILVADSVKVLTKEDEGFKWNGLSFNPRASRFSEPTLLDMSDNASTIYDGIDDFLDADPPTDPPVD